MEILTTLKMVVVGALLTLSGWAGIPLAPQSLGADTMQYVGGTTYALSGSGVSSSGTSIPLTSLTIPQNSYALQDSDFASTFYLTFEPGSQTRQEFASCTTVGTNTGSAVTLSGCTRGLSPISPYTASTTLRFTHAGGTKIIFSNSPAFYDQFVAKGNDETITGIHTFSTSPIVPTPTTATQAANKGYVDTVTNAGAATSTESLGGIVELGTLAEQADSYNGGSDKPTVLQTKNSTSTCQVVGAYNIVASSTTGRLDKNCFDQTASYTFTGATTFSATTTFATTTVASSTITNLNTTNLNNVDISSGVAKNVNIQTFTTAGANTWTKPANALKVLVQIWGAGGSGGAIRGTGGGSGNYASGGGGGNYTEHWFEASSLGSSVTVTVGTGGAAVTGSVDATPVNGNAGTVTTFGSHLTAAFGGAGSANTSDVTGGAGGVLFAAVVNFWGASGAGGLYSAGGAPSNGNAGNSYYGGAGGGARTPGSTIVGGTSTFGGAGGTGAYNGNATAGSQPSGGGGGACAPNGVTISSGAGGAGKAIITTFF